MLGNDLIEFQQMKRRQESLLGEAERLRLLAEARRTASGQRRAQLRLAREELRQMKRQRARSSFGGALRSAAVRLGNGLVFVGCYLQGLDGCTLDRR